MSSEKSLRSIFNLPLKRDPSADFNLLGAAGSILNNSVVVKIAFFESSECAKGATGFTAPMQIGIIRALAFLHNSSTDTSINSRKTFVKRSIYFCCFSLTRATGFKSPSLKLKKSILNLRPPWENRQKWSYFTQKTKPSGPKLKNV